MKGLKEVADFVRENDDIVIVCHYDADGLSAGGVAGQLLQRMGKRYKFFPTKSLDEYRLKEIREAGDNFLFVDLGSGTVETIEKILAGKKVAITDHHMPSSEGIFPHFNAHLAGMDGGYEISGSGIIYLVAKEIDENNITLAKTALVGAIGDMQDSRGALAGKNREILADGIKAGDVELRKDIRLFGRNSRPLIQFLSYCTDPFLPGLTANEDACGEFIASLGIDINDGERWRFYCDLSLEERSRLVSAIYVYAKQHGTPEFVLKNLIGEVYEFNDEPERTELRDAKEFSTMLNACGRNDEAEIGIMVCMGDRGEFLDKARVLLREHRQNLRDGIQWVQDTGVEEMSALYYKDAGKRIKDTIVGTIVGMLYGSGTIKIDKPVLGLSIDDDEKLKISGRGTYPLVRAGLHLGKAMKEASEKFGGAGGGHDIAAGARVELEYKKAFLEEINKIIEKQLKV